MRRSGSSQTGGLATPWDTINLEPGEEPITTSFLILDLKVPRPRWRIALHPAVRRTKRRRGEAFLTDRRLIFRYLFGPDHGRSLEIAWSDVVGWNLDESDPRPGRTGLVVHVAVDGEDDLFALSFYPVPPLPEDQERFFSAFAREFRNHAEMGGTHPGRT